MARKPKCGYAKYLDVIGRGADVDEVFFAEELLTADCLSRPRADATAPGHTHADRHKQKTSELIQR